MIFERCLMDDDRNPTPYDSPELYDLLFDSLDFDVPYWLDFARGAGGPVLELACGTGRLLFPILKAGIDIDGIDSSPAAVHKFSTRQRWVYRFELELLFRAAGFARWEFFGGFDGRPLRTSEDQMIAWAFRG
jgi:SAM-dependent methyltransferase